MRQCNYRSDHGRSHTVLVKDKQNENTDGDFGDFTLRRVGCRSVAKADMQICI
jgi:hypothetical protein